MATVHKDWMTDCIPKASWNLKLEIDTHSKQTPWHARTPRCWICFDKTTHGAAVGLGSNKVHVLKTRQIFKTYKHKCTMVINHVFTRTKPMQFPMWNVNSTLHATCNSTNIGFRWCCCGLWSFFIMAKSAGDYVGVDIVRGWCWRLWTTKCLAQRHPQTHKKNQNIKRTICCQLLWRTKRRSSSNSLPATHPEQMHKALLVCCLDCLFLCQIPMAQPEKVFR